MFGHFFAFLFLFFLSITARDTSFECSWNGADFNSLKGTVYTIGGTAPPLDAYNFTLYLCTTATSGDTCEDRIGSICMYSSADQTFVDTVGSYEVNPTPGWDWIDTENRTKGVVQTFSNGGTCSDGTSRLLSKVFFYCSQDATTILTQVDEPQTCQYEFTFYSPLACVRDDLSSSPIFSSSDDESPSSSDESSPVSSSSSSSSSESSASSPIESSSPVDSSTASWSSSSSETFSSSGSAPTTPLPSPPTNVVLGQSSHDGTAVILTWSLSPNTGDNYSVIGVVIYRNDSMVPTEWVRVTYIGSRYYSTTITGLNPAKAYRFSLSSVNMYGEGEKGTPTQYLPAGRGADTEVEPKNEVLTNFQIFGIVVGGLAFIAVIVLLGYIFLYRSQHKDQILSYQTMSDTATTSRGTSRTNERSQGRPGLALDDGTTLVASGGPVYGFEDAPEGKKKKSKLESDSDDEGQKKKKKKKKSKSKKQRG